MRGTAGGKGFRGGFIHQTKFFGQGPKRARKVLCFAGLDGLCRRSHRKFPRLTVYHAGGHRASTAHCGNGASKNEVAAATRNLTGTTHDHNCIVNLQLELEDQPDLAFRAELICAKVASPHRVTR